ncbi:unnamed protein product, partial [marine sediment metagenome]
MVSSGYVRVGLWALVLALAMGTPQAVAADAEAADVVAKLTARQEQVKSFRYAWRSEHLVPKGGRNHLYQYMPLDSPSGPVELPQPPQDTSVEEVCTLMVQGSNISYRKKGAIWSTVESRNVPDDSSEAYVDGVGYELSTTHGYGGRAWESEVLSRIPLQPLLVAYRLFDPVLGLAKAADVALLGRAEQDGHPCIVIEYVDDAHPPGVRHRGWLAEDLDYSIIRWERDYRRTG